MRLIIAGSRRGFDATRVEEELAAWVEEHGLPDVVLCGEASGVDQQGKAWALSRGVRVESYPADWHKYGKSAGPRRNAEMARNAGAAIIFAPRGSRGSDSMTRIAQAKGLLVHRVYA